MPVRSFLLRPQPATSGPVLSLNFSQLLRIGLVRYAATGWAVKIRGSGRYTLTASIGHRAGMTGYSEVELRTTTGRVSRLLGDAAELGSVNAHGTFHATRCSYCVKTRCYAYFPGLMPE